ncbi:MAG: hydrogenase maturation nickel metallochaperone HypA [Anaerolineaceae bacterium]|nr:hydrogenase maturation nickel metallochaperone HypA [Anaerolineaceae bacterium]
MHELAVTEQILNLALRHAGEANASKVTDLYLEIGALSSIIDDSVQFYWDIISQDSLCQGATLHFNHVPAQLHCQDCDQVYTLEHELTPCPHCDGIHVKIISGQEFQLTSIDIET